MQYTIPLFMKQVLEPMDDNMAFALDSIPIELLLINQAEVNQEKA